MGTRAVWGWQAATNYSIRREGRSWRVTDRRDGGVVALFGSRDHAVRAYPFATIE